MTPTDDHGDEPRATGAHMASRKPKSSRPTLSPPLDRYDWAATAILVVLGVVMLVLGADHWWMLAAAAAIGLIARALCSREARD